MEREGVALALRPGAGGPVGALSLPPARLALDLPELLFPAVTDAKLGPGCSVGFTLSFVSCGASASHQGKDRSAWHGTGGR